MLDRRDVASTVKAEIAVCVALYSTRKFDLTTSPIRSAGRSADWTT